MTQRPPAHAQGAPTRPEAAPERRRLPPALLRALAEEAAVHAETGLAMAGFDDHDAWVEPVPESHDAGGLRIVLRDETGAGLCVCLHVCPTGRVRAQAEGDAAWRSGAAPWRPRGELHLLAWDAAGMLRRSVLGFLLS
jgi:hypothetical protein